MVATLQRAGILSAEEFLCADHTGWELVHGVPEELGVGVESSWFGGEIHRRLANYAIDRTAGVVFPQDSAISIWPGEPNHVRKPDVCFVRKDRITPGFRDAGYIGIVPDLIVEVVSPHDEAGKLAVKIRDYRQAGVPLIWVIYPETESALVYRDGDILRETSDILSADPALPGFELSLPDLFRRATEELGVRTITDTSD